MADDPASARRTQARWTRWAVDQIMADYHRSSDTHLLQLRLPILARHGIALYFKDESTHPTGSLKHRLARSLFLHALCSGWIHEGKPIIEASSGSTAISEAYFARLLGLPFHAVVPQGTAPEKLHQIEFMGGEIVAVPGTEIYGRAHALAEKLGGHYMDQFAYAEQATDWRGNNNIAESMFAQLEMEPHPQPDYVVVGAGTGGTSATIGRYLRFRAPFTVSTELVVADPEHSVFFDYFADGDRSRTSPRASSIEGIGRPRVELSFIREVIDRMFRVPDAASVATIRFLERHLGKRCGASTGTNAYAALYLIAQMVARGRQGSVVTLLCDSGERYVDTYYNDRWVADQGWNLEPHAAILDQFERDASWSGELEQCFLPGVPV